MNTPEIRQGWLRQFIFYSSGGRHHVVGYVDPETIHKTRSKN